MLQGSGMGKAWEGLWPGCLAGMQEEPPQCTRQRLVGCADTPGWGALLPLGPWGLLG